ncbi:hypothetical protein J8I26_12065 [Herbaspirillum sp. LeCh32-8]|uniref:hypothetical protein n=1 Tax=Herbaspirillum sp. LeCh32-8 TaxID=2821356 RepID=UPI001AE95F54|nr:hypothetical protein [Herbaspirillum sp. LeCh32-8]MBP0598846.1 hypothetical protein [Herbaspirillum sp. LeCh32-8]
MNFEEFFREATARKLKLPPFPEGAIFQSSLNNEALFQLPLLAMVILTISKGKSKPLLSELGQVVGECLERTVAGFRGSSQDIGWSANLRIRTVNALTFLERAGLASVEGQTRAISTTEKGREVVNYVSNGNSPLSHALVHIERSFINIRAERRISEAVE